jgi:hypothetical protein
VQSDYYWSATTVQSGPDLAWLASFYGGLVEATHKNVIYYVRAVRGGL